MIDTLLRGRLADVAEIVMGQSPKGETYNQVGDGMPLLNGPTEFGSSHPSPKLWTTSPTRVCKPGDILFCVRGSTTGRMNWADREYCIGRGVGAFRAKTEPIDTRFIFYALVHGLDRLLSLCSGSVFPNLSRIDFERFEIGWPNENNRQAIAHILGTLDDKIELNRRMNETLEEMARAIFKSWFVDFDPVRAKAEGRAPFGMDTDTAALFPSSFQDSPLGKIPEGWSANEIKEKTSNIQYGFTTSAALECVGPMFLRITDIRGGTVDWSTVPYCSANDREHDKYRIIDGDILVARTGASTGENIYIVEPPDAVFASYLVRFQFDDPNIARVVGAYMRTPDYFNYVAGAIGGSAQPNASAQVLAGAMMTFPTPDIAKCYNKLVLPFDKAIAANNRQSVTLAAIRDALLPKLMSGEIRIKDAERFVEERV